MNFNLNTFVENQINSANEELLPQKSKDVYDIVWTKYQNFCIENKVKMYFTPTKNRRR